MFELLLFFMYGTVTSFIGGFTVYWWKVDKIKSVTAAIVLMVAYVFGWKMWYSLVASDTQTLLVLITWHIFVFGSGYKVRLLKNEKITQTRRRR